MKKFFGDYWLWIVAVAAVVGYSLWQKAQNPVSTAAGSVTTATNAATGAVNSINNLVSNFGSQFSNAYNSVAGIV